MKIFSNFSVYYFMLWFLLPPSAGCGLSYFKFSQITIKIGFPQYGELASTTAIIAASIFPVAVYLVGKKNEVKDIDNCIISPNDIVNKKDIFYGIYKIKEDIFAWSRTLKLIRLIFIAISIIPSIFAAFLFSYWGGYKLFFDDRNAIALHMILFSFFCSAIGGVYIEECRFVFRRYVFMYRNYIKNKNLYNKFIDKLDLSRDEKKLFPIHLKRGMVEFYKRKNIKLFKRNISSIDMTFYQKKLEYFGIFLLANVMTVPMLFMVMNFIFSIKKIEAMYKYFSFHYTMSIVFLLSFGIFYRTIKNSFDSFIRSSNFIFILMSMSMVVLILYISLTAAKFGGLYFGVYLILALYLFILFIILTIVSVQIVYFSILWLNTRNIKSIFFIVVFAVAKLLSLIFIGFAIKFIYKISVPSYHIEFSLAIGWWFYITSALVDIILGFFYSKKMYPLAGKLIISAIEKNVDIDNYAHNEFNESLRYLDGKNKIYKKEIEYRWDLDPDEAS